MRWLPFTEDAATCPAGGKVRPAAPRRYGSAEGEAPRCRSSLAALDWHPRPKNRKAWRLSHEKRINAMISFKTLFRVALCHTVKNSIQAMFLSRASA